MGRKKFLFVSAEKGDLNLTGDEHKAIRKLFPESHKYIDSDREAYVSFFDLFNLFESDKEQNENPDIEILHFAGHSGDDGLLFDADNSCDGLISAGKFKEFLSWYPSLKVVILNSCASKYVGEELKEIEHLEVIIETTDTIYEGDAILFTKHFYGYLNKGDEISEAFGKVELMFQNGGIKKQERGKLRETRRGVVKNEKFPWIISKKEGKTWQFFKNLSELDDPNKIKLLCVFPSGCDSKYYDAIKDVVASMGVDFFTENYQRIEKEEDVEKTIDKFDSILFFLVNQFLDFWSADKIIQFKSALQSKKIGWLKCSSGVKVVSEKFPGVDSPVHLPLEGLCLDEMGQDPLKLLLPFKDLGFKELLTPKDKLTKEEISENLKSGFLSLNFEDQIKHFSSGDGIRNSKVNLYVIEGTKDCGHELLIRRILTIPTPPIEIDKSNVTVSTISAHFLAEESLEAKDIWSMLTLDVLEDRILARKGDTNTILSKLSGILKTQDLLIVIDEMQSNNSSIVAIMKFWKEFKELLEGKNLASMPFKLFIFALNKNYSKELPMGKHTSFELCDTYCSLPMEPISKLLETGLNSWVKSPLLYNKLKGDSRYLEIENNPKRFLKEPYIANVINNICNHMNCKDILDDVLKIEARKK